MNVLQLINFGSNELKGKKILSHKLDSELILSKVLNKRREEILTDFDKIVNFENINTFKSLIERRSLKEPIAYIFREKEFWSKIFEVNKNTLVPRPETELMVDKLTKIYKDKNISILDVGTGSGCILISLLSELKFSRGVGIDVSSKALIIAKNNAKKHKINNLKFINRCFTNYFTKKFDLIVSNPPYLLTKEINNLDEDVKKYEPKIALDGGNDGLDVIKKLIYKAEDILKFNGLLALEIGNKQFRKISNILVKRNFKIEYLIKDYNNNIRCLITRKIK